MATINGAVSHWFTELPQPRPALPGDRDADVCIVGAGYTGLWTAYYLKQADPSLRITVLEARFAGFGASGRNGGWLSGLAPGHRGLLAKRYGRDNVVAWQRTLNDAVDEVIEVARRENIQADIVKGGNLEVARNPAQARRQCAGDLQREVVALVVDRGEQAGEERIVGGGHGAPSRSRLRWLPARQLG